MMTYTIIFLHIYHGSVIYPLTVICLHSHSCSCWRAYTCQFMSWHT